MFFGQQGLQTMPAEKRTRLVAVNGCGWVIGEDHPQAKLTEADVALILELRAAGLSYGRIAQKFDTWPQVSKTMCFYICTARRRSQTVMGHRRHNALRTGAASPDEFDLFTCP